MAVSTERTVRDVLVAAIRGVAAELGFSEPSGNVREYPIEWHQEEQLEGYLRAKVGNLFVPRAVAVDVQGFDEPFAMRQVAIRRYSISIHFYYAKGVSGEGYLDLIDHARIVRGVINGISPTLEGTVTRMTGGGQLSRTERSFARGPLVEGVLTYSAERTRPDF